MPDAMKEAVISVLYKGRGKDPLECKSFRPISVTCTPYRILMKAVQIKMNEAAHAHVLRVASRTPLLNSSSGCPRREIARHSVF